MTTQIPARRKLRLRSGLEFAARDDDTGLIIIEPHEPNVSGVPVAEIDDTEIGILVAWLLAIREEMAMPRNFGSPEGGNA